MIVFVKIPNQCSYHRHFTIRPPTLFCNGETKLYNVFQ